MSSPGKSALKAPQHHSSPLTARPLSLSSPPKAPYPAHSAPHFEPSLPPSLQHRPPSRPDHHPTSHVRSTFEYNLEARSALNRFFSGWLAQHQASRAKWAALVRHRYLLGRVKLHRAFWAWKLHGRRAKVTRLKTSLIEHALYRRTLKGCVSQWRDYLAKMKEGNRRLRRVWERARERLFVRYLQYRLRDQQAKIEQEGVRAEFNSRKCISKAFGSLKINI